MSDDKQAAIDYDELSRAVDSGQNYRMADEKLLPLEDSRLLTAELLARPGGKPNLGHNNATGRGRSPKRQVRLPEELNDRLDRFTAVHDTDASHVLRQALAEYLDRAEPAA